MKAQFNDGTILYDFDLAKIKEGMISFEFFQILSTDYTYLFL